MFGLTEEKINTDPEKIEEVLTRGVHDVFTKDELREKLLSGKQLHFKLGTDVTGSFLHLGHSVIHRKLRDFQELGHKVTLIIGDFTTLVGDHSDKVDMRKETTRADVKKMEETYTDQFFKTVMKDQTTIRHNSEWLEDLNFKDIIRLTKQFSIAKMLDRETFMLRYKSGKEIGLDEFLYPVMQGYDSVVLNCDVELGGTDQTFNLLAGRRLMPSYGLIPQNAVVMKLLTGSDGRPMGKSLQNFIPIGSEAEEMYGQVMSIVDDVILDYFELVTRVPMAEIEKMKYEIQSGQNPMIFKKRLAKEIVSFYHGEKEAEIAQKSFENTFGKGGVPDDISKVSVASGTLLVDALLTEKIVESKTEFRRLVSDGAITNMDTNKKITDANSVVSSGTYKIGKRRFVKLKIDQE